MTSAPPLPGQSRWWSSQYEEQALRPYLGRLGGRVDSKKKTSTPPSPGKTLVVELGVGTGGLVGSGHWLTLEDADATHSV
eukprot:scaffold2316_cov20-Tisochrysis_lutea.AAC.6